MSYPFLAILNQRVDDYLSEMSTMLYMEFPLRNDETIQQVQSATAKMTSRSKRYIIHGPFSYNIFTGSYAISVHRLEQYTSGLFFAQLNPQ